MSEQETTFKIIDNKSGRDDFYNDEKIAEFLCVHLDEYGDEKEDIKKCISYVFDKGGLILLSIKGEEIIGAVITNETGMEGYIPENILVYIATHREYRGKGVGKAMMKKIIETVKGDIALHVEPENPAKFLYEKVGMKSKYIEMRLKRK